MPTSSEVLGQLQEFDKSRPKYGDLLSGAENKYGVNQTRQRLTGLRSAITGTENLLQSVDPSVTGRTSGSLVTEAQRSRMVANERAPIAEQLSGQQGAYQNESANYGDLQSQASKEAQLQIAESDSKRSALQSLYDSLYRSEQDAAARAEQQRQFNEQMAESRRQAAAAAANNAYIKSLLESVNSGGATPQTQRPSLDSIFTTTGLSVGGAPKGGLVVTGGKGIGLQNISGAKLQNAGNAKIQNAGKGSVQNKSKVKGGINSLSSVSGLRVR